MKGRQFRIAVGVVSFALCHLRFEPGLVGVRFSASTPEWRVMEILREAGLQFERYDPTDPSRALARAAPGEHVVEAIEDLLRFAPEVTEALPGHFYLQCVP